MSAKKKITAIKLGRQDIQVNRKWIFFLEVNCLLLIVYCLLFQVSGFRFHFLLFTFHFLLFTSYFLLLTFIVYYLLSQVSCFTYYLLLITSYFLLFIVYCSWFTQVVFSIIILFEFFCLDFCFRLMNVIGCEVADTRLRSCFFIKINNSQTLSSLAVANSGSAIINTATKASIIRIEFSTAIHSSMQFMVI